MVSLKEEIEELKRQKNAVVLAHYYVDDDVQAVADYVGDSYYLAKVAVGLKESTIVFAGVKFMGESAKILNPDKTVLMPDPDADCPMAHMAEIEKIEAVRREYDDVAVVCYINSTAELKMHSDVCVTSANAMKIVKALPNKNIYFIPDENLGRYIATKVNDKNFIFNDGFCHVHKAITADDIKRTKKHHPNAKVLIHPECTLDVLSLADYIGSTSGIIDYATNSDSEEFIISTELGVLYELKKKNPNKRFFIVQDRQICPNMKKVTLEKVRDCLLHETGIVNVGEEKRNRSLVPLKKMLELAN
ncbi:MAG: quinolinate synthase NadA [Lachnospiraceae bacterium]|nr:quinolinate synthase NadA [Lachnospiraceae bacterium]